MKASAINDIGGKSETKDHDQIGGPELDQNPEMVRASLSDVRTHMQCSIGVCPERGCQKIVQGGQIMYINPHGGICLHQCNYKKLG